MKAVRLLRSAELEMLDAARYYELQAPGLGARFVDKIESALQDIRKISRTLADDWLRHPLPPRSSTAVG